MLTSACAKRTQLDISDAFNINTNRCIGSGSGGPCTGVEVKGHNIVVNLVQVIASKYPTKGVKNELKCLI